MKANYTDALLVPLQEISVVSGEANTNECAHQGWVCKDNRKFEAIELGKVTYLLLYLLSSYWIKGYCKRVRVI